MCCKCSYLLLLFAAPCAEPKSEASTLKIRTNSLTVRCIAHCICSTACCINPRHQLSRLGHIHSLFAALRAASAALHVASKSEASTLKIGTHTLIVCSTACCITIRGVNSQELAAPRDSRKSETSTLKIRTHPLTVRCSIACCIEIQDVNSQNWDSFTYMTSRKSPWQLKKA